MTGLQRIHHVCLRLKHAFRSRQPRTFIRDTPINRSIAGILQREGFLSATMPGDERGPFVDIVNAASQSRRLSSDQVLTSRQKERLQTLLLARDRLLEMHALVGGGDGSADVDLSTVEIPTAVLDKMPILGDIKILPSVDALEIPSFMTTGRLPTPEEMLKITWNSDKMIWADLRYDSARRPALTDMFLVSRGSRKVHAPLQELKAVMSGLVANPWRASDVGAVTIVRTADGSIVTAREAIDRNEGGEVLCVAK